MPHHLAQLNIGRLKHPLDSAEIKGFVDELEPVNALADDAPGFVWRLQTEDGDATAIKLFDDDQMIINLSVWESVETWRQFVFSGRHLDVMRHRRNWFEKMDEVYTVMWWVPAGHIPSPQEGIARLDRLRAEGPTSAAFTLRHQFAPDGTRVTAERD